MKEMVTEKASENPSLEKGRLISIHKHLSISPGKEGFQAIYTVEPGKILTTKLVQIAFPAGTYGELYIALYYGNMKVFPETEYVSGDNVLFRKNARLKYWSQDPVLVWYKNVNTTETRDCFIDIEGILE